ncbi:hypothetical protein AVEN_179667-1 [Araneus ventricosus]|uniref:DDE-1 domain-containing protein n=1 Tax=Araneus ventricosus TaxID=182803 RepID=A0A4Y2NJL4_ARAVE|nr:hypothetical protein AVEN_179667-1 [Araneus ventricosus]
MKWRCRKQLLSKFFLEGDDGEEEAACRIVQFWRALTLKDCVYMINEAWGVVPEHTLERSCEIWLPISKYRPPNNSGLCHRD